MKLKVYRTPIGFHDAYVAATSQKAALKAWGADADLFARGVAEVVTDPGLIEAPLAHPGAVIRLLRGTEAQHIKALGRKPAAARPRKAIAAAPRAEEKAPVAAPVRKVDKPKPSRPRPSRAALDKAEAAIRDTEARHEAEQQALAARKRALEQEQRDLRARQAAEKEALDAALKAAGAAFRARLEAWAGDAD